MKVYKVLRTENNKLYSCVTSKVDFITEYKKSKWTYPKFKGSRLFVFDTLENAKKFMTVGEEIWECETDKTFKCMFSSNLYTYWKLKIAHKKASEYAVECNIGGALMVDKVKLLRKVG